MLIKRTLDGFTLLELSIVLVIIGFIVGGIMTGKILVHAAEIRQTITQKERFDTATQTFKLKYGYLPGDLPNATTLGFSGGAGDGSGNLYTGGNIYGPEFWFFQHLYEAGLINDTAPRLSGDLYAGDTTPKCPICNVSIETYSVVRHVGGWLIADLNAMPGYWENYSGTFTNAGGVPLQKRAFILTSRCLISGFAPTIKPADAYAIDSKIDDGHPLTGSVLAISNSYYSNGPGGYPGVFNAPVGVTDNAYNSTDDTYQLDLIWQAGF